MIIIVQLLLFCAVVVGTLTLMRGAGNARHQAVRRILLTFFALAAALSVFFPALLTRLANLLGIGRGTDLVLYALIVFFMIYMATSSQRTRQLEARLTKLARRIALDEAPKPEEAAAGRVSAADGGAEPSADDGGAPSARRDGGPLPGSNGGPGPRADDGQLPGHSGPVPGTAGRTVPPAGPAGLERGSRRRPEPAGG
jgi:small membrane protein